MKAYQHRNRFPARAGTRWQLLLTLAIGLSAAPGLVAQEVPDQISYQGMLLDWQGKPIKDPTSVEFRIYDSMGRNDGLKWGRSFQVTPDTNGLFSVVLSSSGAPLGDAPDVSLYDVFCTGLGTEERYLELKVTGSTPIRPRQKFAAAPYAILAHDLTPRYSFEVRGPLSVAGAATVNSLAAVGEVRSATVTATATITAPAVTVTTALTAPTVTATNVTVTAVAKVGSLVSSGAVSATNSTVTASNFVGYGTIPLRGIIMWSGTTLPDGWALCNGQTVNGIATPNLSGRFILASGAGVAGGTRNPGDYGGQETVALTTAQLPAHSHNIHLGNNGYPDGSGDRLDTYYLIDPNSPYGTVHFGDWATGQTGQGLAHPNMPPYYVLAFIMRVK